MSQNICYSPKLWPHQAKAWWLFWSTWSSPYMFLILTGWLVFRAFSIAFQASHISCIIVEITSTGSNTWNKKFLVCNVRWNRVRHEEEKKMTHLGQLQSPGCFLGLGFGSRQRKHFTLLAKFMNSHLHTKENNSWKNRTKPIRIRSQWQHIHYVAIA